MGIANNRVYNLYANSLHRLLDPYLLPWLSWLDVPSPHRAATLHLQDLRKVTRFLLQENHGGFPGTPIFTLELILKINAFLGGGFNPVEKY